MWSYFLEKRHSASLRGSAGGNSEMGAGGGGGGGAPRQGRRPLQQPPICRRPHVPHQRSSPSASSRRGIPAAIGSGVHGRGFGGSHGSRSSNLPARPSCP